MMLAHDYEQDRGLEVSELDLKGSLSMDGSCSTAPIRRECRAAWAVVQSSPTLAPDGTLIKLRSLTGLVPAARPQTPQAAEFAAAVALAEHLCAKAAAEANAYTDYLGVKALFSMPLDVAMQASRIWAGARRLALQFPAGQGGVLSRLQKVKAHQVAQVEEDEASTVARLANEWADEEAKFARRRHPQASKHEKAEVSMAWEDALAACQVLARSSPLWTPPPSRGAVLRAARATTRS